MKKLLSSVCAIMLLVACAKASRSYHLGKEYLPQCDEPYAVTLQ